MNNEELRDRARAQQQAMKLKSLENKLEELEGMIEYNRSNSLKLQSKVADLYGKNAGVKKLTDTAKSVAGTAYATVGSHGKLIYEVQSKLRSLEFYFAATSVAIGFNIFVYFYL